MIKAIMWDVDNTLYDLMTVKKASVEAAVDAMIDVGLTIPKEEMVKHIFDFYAQEGFEHQQVFSLVLNRLFGTIDYKLLSAGIVGYRRAKAGILTVYPGTNRTLLELSRMGIKFCVVTDAPKLEVWLRLAWLGLNNYFDTLVTAEDAGARKPDPAPFKLALQALGTKPEETLMVGDWVARDIVGAKALGITTCWAKYGNFCEDKTSGADYELNHIYEVVEIIRRTRCLRDLPPKPLC